MKRISITRRKGGYGKYRKLRLLVDGKEMGDVSEAQTVIVEVAKEAQYLVVAMDWARGPKFSLADLDDVDELEIQLRMTWNPLRMLGLLQLPLVTTRIFTKL